MKDTTFRPLSRSVLRAAVTVGSLRSRATSSWLNAEGVMDMSTHSAAYSAEKINEYV